MGCSSTGGWRNGVGGLGDAGFKNAVRQPDRRRDIAGIARQRHLLAKTLAARRLDVQHGALEADGEFVGGDRAGRQRHHDLVWLVEDVDQMLFGAIYLRLSNIGRTPGWSPLGLLRRYAMSDCEADIAHQPAARRLDGET